MVRQRERTTNHQKWLPESLTNSAETVIGGRLAMFLSDSRVPQTALECREMGKRINHPSSVSK
jgi:hypothetical protein